MEVDGGRQVQRIGGRRREKYRKREGEREINKKRERERERLAEGSPRDVLMAMLSINPIVFQI